MKRLYALALAAFALLSASAATPKVIDQSKTLELIPAKNLPTQLRQTIGQTVKQNTQVLGNGIHKAPAKVAAIETILGEYDCSYNDIDNNLVETTATLYYNTQYDDYELHIPENNLIDLVFTYDETTGEISFPQLNFGSFSGNLLFQVPLNGTSLTTTLTMSYNETTNEFEIPDNGGLGLAAVNTGGSILGYYWAARNIRIFRSPYDYSLSVTASEECNASNAFSFTITAGSDIASLKYITIPDDMSAADAKPYFAILGSAIQPGTYPLDLNSLEATGPFSLLVAGYNTDGEIVKTAEATVIVTIDEDDAWQTVCDDYEYTDNILSQMYNNVNHSQTVTLQERIGEPGKFRLVNPYSEFNRSHADDHNHYLYLNAVDPEFVNIEYSPTGTDFDCGHLVVGTFGGALGYSKEQVLAQGLVVGSRTGRILTFPTRSILSHESGFNPHGSWSYANANTPVVFTLPDITLDVTVSDKNGNPVPGVELSFTMAAADQPETDDTENIDAQSDETEDDETETPVDDTTVIFTDEDGYAQLTLGDDVNYFDSIVLVAKRNGHEQQLPLELAGAKNVVAFSADEKITTALTNIAADQSTLTSKYYNLQGIEITNPQAGQTVIRVQGRKAEKLIVR